MTASRATAIHRRVDALRAGADPTFVTQLDGGWVVLGERQFLRGCCLLLPDPVADDLNALSPARRADTLRDAARIGDALLACTGARRINYAVFGNQEPALHVHVIPRYDGEPEALRTAQPWAYDWNAAPRFDAGRDSSLLLALREWLR